MNATTYIVQWNVNGLESRLRLGEVECLIVKYNPMCLCLQHIGDYDTNISNYKLVSQSIKTTTELGSAIYVRKNITADPIVIQNSIFQHYATTINISKNYKFTICNVYNQPIFN